MASVLGGAAARVCEAVGGGWGVGVDGLSLALPPQLLPTKLCLEKSHRFVTWG